MQQCSICDKAVYGHPAAKGKLVCGSCTLSASKGGSGGASGKSISQIRLDLLDLRMEQIRRVGNEEMQTFTLKSNFARNKVVPLEGSWILIFNARGEARCPAYMREAVERLMAHKPGRFWILDEKAVENPAPSLSKSEPELVQAEPEVSAESNVVEEDVLPKIEEESVSQELDQSFLVDNKPEPKKRGRKKSRS